MERIRLVLMVLCVYTMALFSCAKEKNIVDVKPLPQSTTEVAFIVALPGLSQNIGTYAITDNEENNLNTVDVLVFKVVNAIETFAYRVRGTNIKPLTVGSSQFQVTLLTHSSEKYRFVVIANARKEVEAALVPSKIAVGTTKAAALSFLVVEKNGVWNTTSNTSYDPLPMWGETGTEVLVNSGTSAMTLSLLRSLARVDVQVNPTMLGTFKMTSVSVYNTNANGRIAPLASNYNIGQKKVTAPSTPSPLLTNSTPLVYSVANLIKSEQEIYLFEKPATAAANASATSLIIGGKYDGSSTETYYKLEFLSAVSPFAPLPILRNHKYVFNIKEVRGEGYATKNAALAAKPSNMQATITTIDMNDVPVVYFDEHYYLAMQTDLVVYPTDVLQDQTYKIDTNAPGGWNAISNENWIIVSKVTNGIKMIVLGGNLSSPRHGTVTVTAGKIRTRIKVYQGYGSSPLPYIP